MILLRRCLVLLLFIPAVASAQVDSSVVISSADSSKRDMPLPLIRTPWTVRSLDALTIRGLPLRGVDQYLPLLSGMVTVNGGLYVRGSRNGETGYLLDGASVFNPWLNSNGVALIPEAIERIEAHTGAYGAELGSFGGGMVNTTMRTGGEKLTYSFNIQSDDFGKPGSSFGIGNFKAVNYGYRNIVGTVGGPLPLTPIRFFLAGQSSYMRSRQPIFFTPFRYDNLVTDNLGSYPAGMPLPGPIEFRENYIGTSWTNTLTLQGNATTELKGIRLKLIGSYDDQEYTEGSQWPQRLQNYYRQKRDMLTRKVTKYLNLQAHYSPSLNLDLDLSLSYYNRFARTYDPDLRNNWVLYNDSLANAQLGYPGFLDRYTPPNRYSTIYNFSFYDRSYPNGVFQTPFYSKENQNSLSLSAAVDWLSDEWTFSAGARIESWTMRSWSIRNITTLNQFMDDFVRDGIWDRTFSSPLEREVFMSNYGGISAIGYRYDNPGQIADDGMDKPATPLFVSAYIQATHTSENLTLDLGARFEHFSPRFRSVPRTLNPTTGVDDWQNPPMMTTPWYPPVLDESQLAPSDPADDLLPRLSISIPLGARLEFHAAYGQYVQMNTLSELYISDVMLGNLINPYFRVPYNLGGPAVTFMARPERSTQYEAGLTTTVRSVGSFSAVFYHKAFSNQLQLARIYNSAGVPIFVGLLNDGKAASEGIEFTGDLSIMSKLRFLFSYAYSEAEGRFKDATSDWRYVSDDVLPPAPDFLIPLEYDENHRGSIIADVKFPEDDDSPLAGWGLDLVFTFNSGHRFSQLMPLQYLGSASPWNVGVRSLMDWRSYEPLAPENTSETPWYFNFDLQVRKKFSIDVVTAEISVSVLNLFNRKHILNVYPSTGSPNDDGWLLTSFADNFKSIPMYEEFYRTINLENRWAYMSATGNDIYGTPRQIRIGLRVGL